MTKDIPGEAEESLQSPGRPLKRARLGSKEDDEQTTDHPDLDSYPDIEEGSTTIVEKASRPSDLYLDTVCLDYISHFPSPSYQYFSII